MNYIVFDLEWNQCPKGKKREDKRLPFEIIEIGAIKLNSEREVTDRIHLLIRPFVYPHLHAKTKEIVNVTEEELRSGIPFQEAIRTFLQWCGPEAVFCTWGDTDLVELQRNMKYYRLLPLLKGPLHFLDVQKLFAVEYEDMNKRRSLEYAIDYFSLEKDDAFHRALSDAAYTASILKRIDKVVEAAYDSIDVYQNPKRKTDEIYAIYNGYSKYISREFRTKEAALLDKEVCTTQCPLCERLAKKKIRWFSVNSKNYYAIGICPKHGYVKGKIRMKKTDNNRFFVVKTVKVSSEQESMEIKNKKDALAKRRRERRHLLNE